MSWNFWKKRQLIKTVVRDQTWKHVWSALWHWFSIDGAIDCSEIFLAASETKLNEVFINSSLTIVMLCEKLQKSQNCLGARYWSFMSKIDPPPKWSKGLSVYGVPFTVEKAQAVILSHDAYVMLNVLQISRVLNEVA